MADQKYAIIGVQECYDIFNANEKLRLGVETNKKTENEIADEVAQFSKKEIVSKLKAVAQEKGADIGAISWDKSEDRFGVYWSVLFSEYISTPIDDSETPYYAFDGIDIGSYLKMSDGQGELSIRSSRIARGTIVNQA